MQKINGVVFNNCTDSGLAKVTVFLRTYRDGNLYEEQNTVSGTEGSFRFEKVSIHSSDDYSYAIYIPGKSGYGAQTPEYCGFTGTTLYFSKNESSLLLKPRVTPKYLFLTYQSNT